MVFTSYSYKGSETKLGNSSRSSDWASQFMGQVTKERLLFSLKTLTVEQDFLFSFVCGRKYRLRDCSAFLVVFDFVKQTFRFSSR